MLDVEIGCVEEALPNDSAEPDAERIIVRPRVPILKHFDLRKLELRFKDAQTQFSALFLCHRPRQYADRRIHSGDELGESQAMRRS